MWRGRKASKPPRGSSNLSGRDGEGPPQGAAPDPPAAGSSQTHTGASSHGRRRRHHDAGSALVATPPTAAASAAALAAAALTAAPVTTVPTNAALVAAIAAFAASPCTSLPVDAVNGAMALGALLISQCGRRGAALGAAQPSVGLGRRRGAARPSAHAYLRTAHDLPCCAYHYVRSPRVAARWRVGFVGRGRTTSNTHQRLRTAAEFANNRRLPRTRETAPTPIHPPPPEKHDTAL